MNTIGKEYIVVIVGNVNLWISDMFNMEDPMTQSDSASGHVWKGCARLVARLHAAHTATGECG